MTYDITAEMARPIISPNLITTELILHIAYADDPTLIRHSDYWSAPHFDAIKWLVKNRLIDVETWKPTERGLAWVRFLMQVPLPVSFTDWRLPREEPTR